jgi:hypothetical protein
MLPERWDTKQDGDKNIFTSTTGLFRPAIVMG